MGAGVLSLPNASQKICITRGESRDRVFASASDFLLHRARSPRTPLISSWNRRICFLRTTCAISGRNQFFFALFHFISFLGTRPAGVLRRPGHRKNYQPSGLCPASYGEPRRQLNSHNGKEYPPSWGSTRRRQRRACQGRADAVKSGRRNRYRQRGVNENCILRLLP